MTMKIDQQIKLIIEDTIELIDEYERKVDYLNTRSKKTDKIIFISLGVSGLIITLGVLILLLK